MTGLLRDTDKRPSFTCSALMAMPLAKVTKPNRRATRARTPQKVRRPRNGTLETRMISMRGAYMWATEQFHICSRCAELLNAVRHAVGLDRKAAAISTRNENRIWLDAGCKAVVRICRGDGCV